MYVIHKKDVGLYNKKTGMYEDLDFKLDVEFEASNYLFKSRPSIYDEIKDNVIAIEVDGDEFRWLMDDMEEIRHKAYSKMENAKGDLCRLLKGAM